MPSATAPGGGDDVFGLAGGELQRADVGRIQFGDTLRIKAEDNMIADMMLRAKVFRQSPPRGCRPPQVDLLCADQADQGRGQVGKKQRAKAAITSVQPRNQGIRLCQFGEGRAGMEKAPLHRIGNPVGGAVIGDGNLQGIFVIGKAAA